nr:MAG TPA: hypothetical protein [Caudoviricetes sp.]
MVCRKFIYSSLFVFFSSELLGAGLSGCHSYRIIKRSQFINYRKEKK